MSPAPVATPKYQTKHLTPVRRVSIVLPVYNEQGTIADVVDRVLRASLTLAGSEYAVEKELVIVDDFSGDGTREALPEIVEAARCMHAPTTVTLLMHEVNRGKGAALRTGFTHASGDVVLIQDADFEYDPRDYPVLLEPILDGWADVVYGNRFHGGPHRVLYYWHYLSNLGLTTICNVLTGPQPLRHGSGLQTLPPRGA